MDEGDCRYFCCGRCRGLFEELDELVAHKLHGCDGKPSSSECQLFACERDKHLGHNLDLDRSNAEPKVTRLRAGRKRRESLAGQLEEEIPLKKSKITEAKKTIEKKECRKESLPVAETGLTAVNESPAGRRASGRVRSTPLKYKDFSHQLQIKEEPPNDGFSYEEKTRSNTTDPPSSEPTVSDNANQSTQTVKSTEENSMVGISCIVDVSPGEEEGDTLPGDVKDSSLIIEANPAVDSANLESSFETETDIENSEIVEVNEEAGIKTRSRRIRMEHKKIKDEPESLIKEIFHSGMGAKKQNFFNKEQKEVLIEKYKEYYKLEEIKVKNEKKNDNPDLDMEVGEDETENNSDEADKEKDHEDKDTTEKENRTSTRKIVKKKEANGKNKAKDTTKPRWLYNCPICVYTTKYVGFFESHMTRAHDNGKVWKCDECEYTHHNKGIMRLHRNAHIKPFMCEYCSHKFSTGIDLKKHRYTHTGETPYKCKECDWAGRQKKALIEHMRKHTGEKLKCTAVGCSFETTYRWALEQHRRSKHEEGHRFQCAECPYATSDSGSFAKHKKYHQGLKDYKCGQCSYKGITKNDVIKHMRIHTHEKLYFCDRCQYSSCHSSAFKSHMMSHLGLKTWQCKFCGFSASTRAKVIRHLETRHQSRDKTNAINLPTKLQLNFDDFKVPPGDARSNAANIVYEVIEAVEGSAEDPGAIAMKGEEGHLSVVTHVNPDEFQGLADLAAASEAVAAQEEHTVTQIIVQTVDPDGNPTEEEQHIEVTGLSQGRLVSLPGGVVALPPGIVELQSGEVVTTSGDGANITYVEETWPTGAGTCLEQETTEENVVETYIIEEPVEQM